MTPNDEPCRLEKMPFTGSTRLWMRRAPEERLRGYVMRRYQDGTFYWSEVHHAPERMTVCMTCFLVIPAPPTDRWYQGWCASCGGVRDFLQLP